MRGLVVALAFESKDGVSVFLKKIPSRAIGDHKAIERLLGLEVLLVLQGIAVGELGSPIGGEREVDNEKNEAGEQ